MCFPRVSGVSAHLKKRPKQAKNGENNCRRGLDMYGFVITRSLVRSQGGSA
jgi:hypothetical protein